MWECRLSLSWIQDNFPKPKAIASWWERAHDNESVLKPFVHFPPPSESHFHTMLWCKCVASSSARPSLVVAVLSNISSASLNRMLCCLIALNGNSKGRGRTAISILYSRRPLSLSLPSSRQRICKENCLP